MDRRHLLTAAAAWGCPAAFAHHGWSSFDPDHPLYLEGRAVTVRWRNPHVEFDLEVPADLRLPDGLASRVLPAQTAAVDGPALLAKTQLPKLLAKTQLPKRRDRRWTIELAPLTRMDAWRVQEIKPGTALAVVGFTLPGEKGEAVLRAEYLFVDGKTYGLRSSPA